MLVIFYVNKKMTSFRGQTGWGKMTSPKGKQTAPSNQKVNKA
jgi:hypothetical protein